MTALANPNFPLEMREHLLEIFERPLAEVLEHIEAVKERLDG